MTLGTLLAAAAVDSVVGGPPYPEPFDGTAVYDPAGAIGSEVEQRLEARIDEIENRSAAEIAILIELDPDVDAEAADSNAAALMDQWGVGRSGFDDGLVILVALDETLTGGQLVLYGGSGFDAVYANEERRQQIFDDTMLPRLRADDVSGALEAGLGALDPLISADGRARLDRARQLNAVLGLALAPLLLMGTLGTAAMAWWRSGRDPGFLDSPSVLMAGPPRTAGGAQVDGMLKAYRRTLQLTMEQARSMEQVVAEPLVRTLADTPDRAVMWGIALGLHREVSTVLARSLEDRTRRPAATAGYYPLWLGSAGSGDGTAGLAGGSILSGSSPAPRFRMWAACSTPSAASAPAPPRAVRARVAAASRAARAGAAAAPAAVSEPRRWRCGARRGIVPAVTFNRRPDRRPSGPRAGGFRPDRRDFDRSAGPPRGDRPDRDFAPRGDRPPGRDDRGDRPPFRDERGFAPRPDRPPFRDEGGMSLRLDPRHIGQLKRIAGELGLRPGELAMQWISERLDAEMRGTPSPAAAPELAERLDELAGRLAALEASVADQRREVAAVSDETDEAAVEEASASDEGTAPQHASSLEAPGDTPPPEPAAPFVEDTAPDAAAAPISAAPRGERIGLHDEIIAVIREQGPLSAGEMAKAIAARGRYAAPRSSKPLDAATVNSRVSNPAYRGRFTRSDGRIGLADEA